MAEITIIIPTYNGMEFLPAAVGSALAQTWKELVIQIVDNGSTDSTREWVNAQDDPRIRYHYQENSGCPAGSRNTGLDLARSPFVAFLDADDLWHPTKLERQMPRFDNPRVGLVYTGEEYIDAEGRRLPQPPVRYLRGRVVLELLDHNFVSSSTVVVRREVIEQDRLRFRPGRKGVEDWDLWVRLAARCDFDYVDDKLASYRIHGANTSQAADMMHASMMTALADLELELPQSELLTPEERVAVSTVCTRARRTHTRAYALELLGAGRRGDARRVLLDSLKRSPLHLPTWHSLAKSFLSA